MSLLNANRTTLYRHSLALRSDPEPTKTYDPATGGDITTYPDPVTHWTGKGSLQSILSRANPQTLGTVGGAEVDLPEYRAYLSNTPEVQAALKAAEYLVDLTSGSLTYEQRFELLELLPMGGGGPIRVNLRKEV